MSGIEVALYLVIVFWGLALFHLILAIQSSHCKPAPKAFRDMYIQQIGLDDNGF